MKVPGGADSGVLLAGRGVSRRYGRQVALAQTDFAIRPGDTTALIGPNGAGKSTLLGILAGALEPTDGRVAGAAERAKVGWVPQRPSVYSRLSPQENLEFFARLQGEADPSESARKLLELVELAGEERLVSELSLGNQQRLNLAVALIGEPLVLLLDEPTASLDPRQRRRLWETAARITSRGGAVVFATQNLEELERFASRVVILLHGELVFDGTLEEYGRSPEADVFA